MTLSNQFQKIVQDIKKYKQKGYTNEKITEFLQEQNIAESEIEQAFEYINPKYPRFFRLLLVLHIIFVIYYILTNYLSSQIDWDNLEMGGIIFIPFILFNMLATDFGVILGIISLCWSGVQFCRKKHKYATIILVSSLFIMSQGYLFDSVILPIKQILNNDPIAEQKVNQKNEKTLIVNEKNLLLGYFPKQIGDFSGTCSKIGSDFFCNYAKEESEALVEIQASQKEETWKEVSLDGGVVNWRNYALKQDNFAYAWKPNRDFSVLFFSSDITGLSADNVVVLNYFLEKFGIDNKKMKPYVENKRRLPLVYDDMILMLTNLDENVIMGDYRNTVLNKGVSFFVAPSTPNNNEEFKEHKVKNMYGKEVLFLQDEKSTHVGWLTDENKNTVGFTFYNSKKESLSAEIISKKDFDFFMNLFGYSGYDLTAKTENGKGVEVFDKVGDANRISSTQSMGLIMKVDAADVWDNKKFIYTAKELKSLFDINSFVVPKLNQNIGYLIVMLSGENDSIGDDNQFLVVSWGKTKSFSNAREKGLIVEKTMDKELEIVINNLKLEEADFHSENLAKTTQRILTAFGENGKGLYIDEKGLHDVVVNLPKKVKRINIQTSR